MKLPASSEKATSVKMAIAKFIALNCRPLSIVEGEGYCQLLHVLEPRYQVPTHQTITRHLWTMEVACREKVNHELSIQESIALTTDFWTSKAVESYVGVTTHFIDDCAAGKWELRTRILETEHVIGEHIADKIWEILLTIAEKWALAHKVKDTGVTPENAANIVEAVAKELKWERCAHAAARCGRCLTEGQHNFEAPCSC